MAKTVAEAARKFLLLGQCVPTVKQNAAKIRIKRLELDENLLMVRNLEILSQCVSYSFMWFYVRHKINFTYYLIFSISERMSFTTAMTLTKSATLVI